MTDNYEIMINKLIESRKNITFEEKINSLIERISNNETNYSNEDIFIIEHSDELIHRLVKKIGTGEISVETFNIGFIDFLSDYICSNFNLDDISKEEFDKAIIELTKKLIIKYGYDHVQVGSILSYIEHPNNIQLYNQIQEYIDTLLDNKSLNFDGWDEDESFIVKLLDHKRYDVIQDIHIHFDMENYISEATYKRLKSEGTYTSYPDIIYNYERKIKFFKDMPIDKLMSCFFEEFTNNKSSSIVEEIKQLIIEKVDQYNNLSNLNDSFMAIYYFLSYLSEEERNNIQKKFFDKYCFVEFQYLLKNGIVTQDQLKQKCFEADEKGYLLPDDLINYFRLDISKMNQLRLRFENGKSLEFLRQQINANNISEYAPYIIQCSNNNEYLKKNLIKLEIDLKNNIEIFELIVNYGQLTQINLDKLGIDDRFVELIIKACNINPNLSLSGAKLPSYRNDKLVNGLIANNHADILVKCIHFEAWKDKFEILKSLNDYNVFYSICNSYLDSIINYPEIINFYFSTPGLVEIIIEKIAQAERTQFLFDQEKFDMCKEYFAKKYKLNDKHLNELEKKFGSKILMYISNEQIHNIINLGDEEFYQILNLFPNVKYEISDLEAAYYSLVQVEFSKQNSDIVDFFSNFVHALDAKKYDEINKLSEILIINTRPELLEMIVNNYNLTSVRDTGELLKLIVSKYDIEQERKYYINILHILADEYVKTSREHNQDNYFFNKKKLGLNFYDILHKIENNQFESFATLLSNLDPNYYNTFNAKFNTNILDNNAMLHLLAQNINNPSTRNLYLPYLKIIIDACNNNIKMQHAKELSFEEIFKLPYSLDVKDTQNKLVSYYIKNCDKYYIKDSSGNLIKIIDVIINEMQRELGNSALDVGVLVNNIIACYNGKKEFGEEKKYFGIFMKIANKYLKSMPLYNLSGDLVDSHEIIKKLDAQQEIKRQYYVDTSANDFYPILLNLNIKLLRNTILYSNIPENKENYDYLLKILAKKKIYMQPYDLFKELLEECNIIFDFQDISALYNYFIQIEKEAIKDKIDIEKKGVAWFLNEIETFAIDSTVYSQILGMEDARLIKKNPIPNAATKKLNDNARLKEAVQFTIALFNGQEVTVPTFDEVFEFESENGEVKSINAIVGNFTAPCNLTHGERTGACMRIGGAGESLFNFCILDPNGFHIRFEDPETHKYISRVSGFRNGNTVFLNELRNSCIEDKYTDFDVVQICKIVAQQLIEKSKKSACPIENVVISDEYAMEDFKDDVIPFNITSNKVGLPEFYSDIKTSGIVLATTAQDTPLVPINFDKSKVPVYRPVRSKKREMEKGNKLISAINRVASVISIIEGNDYEDLDALVTSESDIIYGVVNDDWYIYVDSNNNIYGDYIEIDPRCKQEFEQELEAVKAKFKPIGLGGDKHVI